MQVMDRLRGVVRGPLAERVLEPLLALLLAGLAVLGQLQYVHPHELALWLDLLTCIAAALGAFRPKEGPWVYFAVLLAYLFVPVDWITLGELSVLIPILGMGIRGQKRTRLVLSRCSSPSWSTAASGMHIQSCGSTWASGCSHSPPRGS